MNYGTELNHYQVKQAYPYPGNIIGIEVYFKYTKIFKECKVNFNDLDMPEGDYNFDSTDKHYIVNPDNSVTFFYKKFDGHGDIVKVDLEPVINEILEANHCTILYEFI